MHIFFCISLVVILNFSVIAGVINTHASKNDTLSTEVTLFELYDTTQSFNFDDADDQFQWIITASPAPQSSTKKTDLTKTLSLTDTDVSERYSIRAPPTCFA